MRPLALHVHHEHAARHVVERPDGSKTLTTVKIAPSTVVDNVKYYQSIFENGTSIKIAPQRNAYFDRYGREVGTAVEHFSGGWRVTQNEYDSQGRLSRQYQPGIGDNHSNYIAYTYDAINRPATISHPNGLVETSRHEFYNGYSRTNMEKASNGQSYFDISEMNGLGERVKAWQYGEGANSNESQDVAIN